MFRVTQAAAAQVKVAAQQGGTDGMPLRLAARQKPDGSIDYLMGFDEASEEDISLTCEGVEIVMEPEYVPPPLTITCDAPPSSLVTTTW